MSATVLVTADELAAERAHPHPPAVFDATLLLPRPRFDGDFRSESGRERWLAERVPGSQHVAVDLDFSVPDVTHDRHPEPPQIIDRLARLGVGPTTGVVVYDSVGGLWAARLWYLLDWAGVAVRVLDGGWRAWRDAGHPVASGDPDPVPEPVPSWPAPVTREAWVERAEVRARQGDGSLVCGLAEPVFAGREATRYTRRGHIPGSVNVPARSLLDADGRLRPPAEIREIYSAAGVDLRSEVLLYCGGGISATLNALALAHAGIRNVRVYDGSLEEWSADPELPLVSETASGASS